MIFRASNWYRKGVWRDWVEIDWGDEGLLKDRSMWREDFESWLESPDETLDIPDNDDIPRVDNREAAEAWNNDVEYFSELLMVNFHSAEQAFAS